MFRLNPLVAIGAISSLSLWSTPLFAQVADSQSLFLAYPPDNHQTRSEQIFLIGSADPNIAVTLNGQPVERSSQGNFAPVLPLAVGENRIVIEAGSQTLERVITRQLDVPQLPPGNGLVTDSLFPPVAISRSVNEPICFTALAPTEAQVQVTLSGVTVPLTANGQVVQLPANNSLLYGENQPQVAALEQYSGCQTFQEQSPGLLGTPEYQVQWQGKQQQTSAAGSVSLLNPDRPQVITVTTNPGVARTGPGTNYSRLTPLPQGTQAAVTGTTGEWLRLDYGGWIRASKTSTLTSQIPPRSLIRSVGYRRLSNHTEFRFPLERPIPVTVHQAGDRLRLTLHNTTAQTDTIRVDADPLLRSFSWQQLQPGQVTYDFQFKSAQQWGYDLRYEGTTLVLALQHPPKLSRQRGDLTGIKILLDPGHGGKESGALGPTGYPEKDINLVISLALAEQLQARGAEVFLTRTTDKFVSLQDRVAQMQQLQPAIILSVHYNALPDSGDPNKIKGISTFWYHPQSEGLAQYLQQSLVNQLDRDSQGVFFNSLAVIRPAIAPAVLLELGYMIHPQEFEWITDPQAQEALVGALTTGVVDWFYQQAQDSN